MKYKKFLLLISFTLFVLFLFEKAFSVETYEVLRGIDRITVLIEELDENAQKIGLTKDRLKTITELKLRREGIKIYEIVAPADFTALNSEEKEKVLKIPNIYVNVKVVGKAFNVSLEINEAVTLFRDNSIRCIASTWNRSVTGIHANESEYMVNALSILLDEFLNCYYKANPKK